MTRKKSSAAQEKPVVLVIAGHDPVGGAGVQADIEAIAALGCHAATAITALTVQDTRNVVGFTLTDASLLRAQLDVILGDLKPAAVKIGMIGSANNAREIARALQRLPGVPVVLDPVLVAGGGGALALADLRAAMTNMLFPLATVITPNGPEARTLANQEALADCARALAQRGAQHVLITGGHESGAQIVTRLYRNGEEISAFSQPRLPGNYHGSGCTLASALAARLACGSPLKTATRDALDYVAHTLGHAQRPGHGQSIPHRFFHLDVTHDVNHARHTELSHVGMCRDDH